MTTILYESFIAKHNKENDYNLLRKIVLSQIGTKQASEQANILLKRFGTIQDVFGATTKDLTSEKNIEPLVIKEITKIKNTINSILRTNLTSKPVIGNIDNVVKYYKSIFLGKTRQQFHVLFLNEKHQFLAEHCMQIGTVNNIVICPKEIIKTALKYNATEFIMVRNHPGGYALPSQQDTALLKYINEVGPQIQLNLFEYIVIGEGNDCNFLNNKIK